MVRKKDIARSKMRAIESEVSEMLKGSERMQTRFFVDLHVTCKTRSEDIDNGWGDSKKETYRSSKVLYAYLCPFAYLRSHTKSKLPLSDLDNFDCVLSNRLTEHISGTYADAW